MYLFIIPIVVFFSYQPVFLQSVVCQEFWNPSEATDFIYFFLLFPLLIRLVVSRSLSCLGCFPNCFKYFLRLCYLCICVYCLIPNANSCLQDTCPPLMIWGKEQERHESFPSGPGVCDLTWSAACLSVTSPHPRFIFDRTPTSQS